MLNRKASTMHSPQDDKQSSYYIESNTGKGNALAGLDWPQRSHLLVDYMYNIHAFALILTMRLYSIMLTMHLHMRIRTTLWRLPTHLQQKVAYAFAKKFDNVFEFNNFISIHRIQEDHYHGVVHVSTRRSNTFCAKTFAMVEWRIKPAIFTDGQPNSKNTNK